MRSTKIPFPYSAEQCNGPGEYFARLYTADRPQRLAVIHQKLGQTPIGAHDILVGADMHAAELGRDASWQRKGTYPLGCTVLKFCKEQGHVEIVENALAVPANWETFKVLTTPDVEKLHEDDSGTAEFLSRVRGYPNPPDTLAIRDDAEVVPLRVLPHIVTPLAAQHGTQGVRIDRGGLTFGVNFCLLGDERLITLQPPLFAAEQSA